MGQIILNWGFPFYLILLEVLFRSVTGFDTSSFVGPAIATAGLSFMLPLTKAKELESSLHGRTLAVVNSNGGVIVNLKDQALIPFVWLSILLGFMVWFWASNTSLKSPTDTFLFFPTHVAIGLINYVVAAVLSAVKGRL
ncbi:hypothetical protein [Pseudoalteromonas sp. CnMc7-37]|uniref:hypothetical protein n=1 Tax=Pseudoalteromonas sp. CnMc7-37 TaxID=2954496 RepID=UPI0020980E1A|nr:hypothetical protein [Pseudoalteromonas sp. CnMc7-37]MCO7205322.1 hypothetical protein [Pseudoalteromonas sp. CnMc7-37]